MTELIALKDSTQYTLTSSYALNKRTQDGFLVCYNLNSSSATGGPSEPTYGNLQTGTAKLSSATPSRPGCRFLGWSLVSNDKVADYQSGETVTFSNRPNADYVEVFAVWKSDYKFTLDSNGETGNSSTTLELTNALPNETVDLNKYKNVFGKPDGCKLAGWGVTPDTLCYAPDTKITVPEKDFTLYAIWAKDQYQLILHDQFSLMELGRTYCTGKQTITIPDIAPEIPGYTFIGWKDMDVTSDRDEYEKNGSIYMDEDIDLVAVYDPVGINSNKFTIVYLPNGGTGGPGLVEYAPGEVVLSEIEPTFPGYEFLGWSTQNMFGLYVGATEYPRGIKNTITGVAGERIELYAVWALESSNRVKFDLEDIYGPAAIDDAHFDRPYESTDWEYINDTAYYVVKTRAGFGSILCDTHSTAMVLEFYEGGWNLKAYGTKEGNIERLRLNILTAVTNTPAEILDSLFKIGKAALDVGCDLTSAYFPGGIIVNVVEILDELVKNARKLSDYDFLEDLVMKNVSDKTEAKAKGTIDGLLLGQALVVANSGCGLAPDDEAGKYLVTLFKVTLECIKEDLTKGNGGMDPFGNYDVALAMFQQRVKDQEFCDTIVNNIPHYIDEIYKHISY